MNRVLHFCQALLILCFSMSVPLRGNGNGDGNNDAHKSDRLTLSLQNETATQLLTLAAKYRGTPQELPVLLRVIDNQEQMANLEFRIAYGAVSATKKPVDLSRYKKSLTALRTTASRVIQSYPQTIELARVIFIRAQAAHELHLTTEATRDYQALIEQFPRTSHGIRAFIALAQYATEAKNHAKAISLLKKVEETPADIHYPMAIHQLAWSHFNLGQIPTALHYLKLHVATFAKKQQLAPDHKLSSSDEALRDQSLKEVVTFYFEGCDRRIDGYGTSKALSVFRSYTQTESIGRMILAFAKLIRSRDHESDLEDWTDIVIQNEARRSEVLEVWTNYYEYLLLRDKLDHLPAAATRLQVLHSDRTLKITAYPAFPAALTVLLTSAAHIQKQLLGQPAQTQRAQLTHHLKSIYSVFLSITESSDPRVSQVHYNLAETLFSLKQYREATAEYGRVLNPWNSAAGLNEADVRLKRVSSRYQELLEQNHFPKALEPKALEGNTSPTFGNFPEIAQEWTQWLAALKTIKPPVTKAILDTFDLELNRMLYFKGQTRAACNRLFDFTKANPTSPLSPVAASLVLDTLVHNERWEETLSTLDELQKLPPFGNVDFRARLSTLPHDISYKMMERDYRAKEYAKVIQAAESYATRYPQNPRGAAALLLASRAAQQLHDTDKAMTLLNSIATHYPNAEDKDSATLTQATLSENNYLIDSAVESYASYLFKSNRQQGAAERDAIVKRFWFLNWLAKTPRDIHCTDYKPESDIHKECDRYQALTILAKPPTRQPLNPKTVSKATIEKKALGGYQANRPLWAAIALRNPAGLTPKQQLRLAITLVNTSKELDPLIQLTLIPILNRQIPEVFERIRQNIPNVSKLKAESRALNRRMEQIKDLEQAAGELVSAPWANIRIATLTSVAQAYLDFCGELSQLKLPKGLTPQDKAQYLKSIAEIMDPFKAKGKALQDQSKELASHLPFPAARLDKTRELAVSTNGIELSLLDRTGKVPSSSHVPSTPNGKPSRLELLTALWSDAYKQNQWARMAYFFQELKTQPNLSPMTHELMTVLTLHRAGAQVEALSVLESSLPKLDDTSRKHVSSILHAQYLNSTAPDKAASFVPKSETDSSEKKDITP